MEYKIAQKYRSAILRQYDRNLSRCPLVKEEVDAFLQGKDETFVLSMQYLYGHMPAQDLLSFSPELFAGYVRATLEVLGQIEYLRSVPEEVFFPFVLFHRVNSEWLDDSRGFLMRELLPYVQGKTMEQAALAVNYWCYAHATYTPADSRTLGPMAVLKRTMGRCGEETVLAVAALRSVGIPARQCYCPRWSHCDDNHAWVEVWIDGNWHYMGACEPEAVLDRGWFTAAASRAMLIDTKCWADWEEDSLYRTVGCTSRYTTPRILSVQVTEKGLPVCGANVRFQVVNYSELFTLWETVTDEKGYARFETGQGDLIVYAQHGKKVALQKVDLRQQDVITLEMEANFPEYMRVDLAPPEDTSGTVPHEEDFCHKALLHRCEAYLSAQRATFSREEYLCQAALNAPEIRSFLEDSNYTQVQKQQLLSTLRPKDFVDMTYETLADALEVAACAESSYSPEVFRDYILALRIADEMLLPERQKIRTLFPEGFEDPREILTWMEHHIELLPDEGIRNYYPSALGCLKYRRVPAFAFDTVFVALCRAFRFPSRLEPQIGEAQWMDRQYVWHNIRPVGAPVDLTLEISEGKILRYSEHLTLGRWDGNTFATLKYPDLTVEGQHTFSIQPGLYRITVTTRQMDGTASVAIWHITLSDTRRLRINPPEDQTAGRLKRIPLCLPDGPVRKLLRQQPNSNDILIFAAPGSEPTEHLLVEMMETAHGFQELPGRILLFVEEDNALQNVTLQRLMKELPKLETFALQDLSALTALHQQMKVGDLRLPFVICIDNEGNGVYADANYRIRLAQTLLDIQRLLCKN